SNAVKFTPDGGAVTVRAGREDDELIVSVQDTGVGVSEEDRERIFESFQQGARVAPNEEGTGLGLTLCRRILELLGGPIWLQSEVGVGSTFAIALPMTPRVPHDGSVPDAGQRRDVLSVVLIDDDRPSVDLISAYLEGADCEVNIAYDGVQGLALVRR